MRPPTLRSSNSPAIGEVKEVVLIEQSVNEKMLEEEFEVMIV